MPNASKKNTRFVPLTGDRRHELTLPRGAKILAVEGATLLIESDEHIQHHDNHVFHSAKVGELVPTHYEYVGIVKETSCEGSWLILWREPS
ncbi:MAG: hypothetical protein K2W82_17460 [Candidatus Obscuribacterales bacterium]|nr:hypothetical protein [Candidatus Obscuribacterales bacterium]